MPCSRSVGQPAVMYVAGTALPVATFKFLLEVGDGAAGGFKQDKQVVDEIGGFIG